MPNFHMLVLSLALGAVLIFGGFPRFAEAGQVHRASVDYRDGAFSIVLEMHVYGDADVIRRLLTDYEHLSQFNDSVTESQQLESPDPDVLRARIVTEDCIAFLCAKLVQVQDVRQLPEGDLVIRILPSLSDYTTGNSVWHIAPETGGGTYVRVEALMAPKLWIPPLVGPSLVASMLRDRAIRMVDNLEALAARGSDFRG
jgi:hypothetical protein